mmetsp:Transcript_27609/g.72768  ORF Transcript_27609/g.72768 Transcript_27609/m.72768 type:complete len:282 (+) Transcript_27609:876-1721(+)
MVEPGAVVASCLTAMGISRAATAISTSKERSAAPWRVSHARTRRMEFTARRGGVYLTPLHEAVHVPRSFASAPSPHFELTGTEPGMFCPPGVLPASHGTAMGMLILVVARIHISVGEFLSSSNLGRIPETEVQTIVSTASNKDAGTSWADNALLLPGDRLSTCGASSLVPSTSESSTEPSVRMRSPSSWALCRSTAARDRDIESRCSGSASSNLVAWLLSNEGALSFQSRALTFQSALVSLDPLQVDQADALQSAGAMARLQCHQKGIPNFTKTEPNGLLP